MMDSSGDTASGKKYSYHILVRPTSLCVDRAPVNRFIRDEVVRHMSEKHDHDMVNKIIDGAVYSKA